MKVPSLFCMVALAAGCGDKEPVDSGEPTGDSAHSDPPDSEPGHDSDDSAPPEDSADTQPPDDTGPPEPAAVYELADAHARVLGRGLFSQAGLRVATAGDVDGDGWEDLLVGSNDDDGVTDSDTVYLLAGPFAGDLTTGDAIASLLGEEENQAAFEVCRGGDMDGDGQLEVVVGASGSHYFGTSSGAVYVQRGPVLGALSQADAASILTGVQGVDYVGHSVAVGDANADGLADLWIGGFGYDGGVNGGGAAFLFLGPTPASATVEEADAVLQGLELHEGAGYTVDFSGDVDGDGLLDLLVGAPWPSSSYDGLGRVYLVLDTPSGVSALADADAVFEGEALEDELGMAVATLDLDGDGYADPALGALGNDRGGEAAGAVYVVSGTASGSFAVVDAAGWVFLGVEAVEQAGHSVASAGDGDGDGRDDLLVGASNYDDARGQVYLLRDPPAGTSSLEYASARFRGEADRDYVGYGHGTLSGGADLTGDGVPDWVVGAFGASVESRDQGAAYLWSGAAL
jgi:hypothetical protein